MASPEPNGYPHHLYGHLEHTTLPSLPLPPPPPPPQHPGHPSHETYSERYLHFPEQQHQFPRASELEQPLDLSLARTPRPLRVESMLGGEGGMPRRPRLEEDGREATMDMCRPGHSSVCMMRGCNCHSPMPVHHPPHYSRHRHSPYPQFSVSGHSSPAVSDMQPYPHSYSAPQPPAPSSPGMTYSGGSTSPYIPPPQDRHSLSPGLGVTYRNEMVPQRPSPGAVLCPPPDTSFSSLSSSPLVHDISPCPTSQSSGRMQDVSPRPLYRPFEDVVHLSADMPHAAPIISSSTRMNPMEPYPSEDDLSASSTLLMLSNTTSESRSSVPTRQTADSSMDYFKCREEPLLVEETSKAPAEPSQSDSDRPVYHQLQPHPSSSSHFFPAMPVESSQPCGNEARSQPYITDSQPVGPAQDGTVASSRPSDDLIDSASPKQDEKKIKNLKSRIMKVVGTTPLATLRKERAKQQAMKKEKMKVLLAPRNERFNSNDSEGARDVNNSSQVSPRSSDGSDNDVAQGFPIPPDPNLKMSALDYLISKVLVERIDVPFKACNTEINEIYTGAKKGRLTLVDLIELQVEASLKA